MNVDEKPIRQKKIVICGSMLFFDEMVRCQQKLKELGIDSIVPKEENDTVGLFNEEQFLEFKKKVSSAYLKKIRDKETMGVLIYNAEKKGSANYIGANTLVELAMAFTWNRKFFLLCNKKILIPASNYFESDLAFEILNELKDLNDIGANNLISSSHNIDELLSKKASQHGNNISISNYHYSDFLNNDKGIILPGALRKREPSASSDIKAGWYTSINSTYTRN